jgi:hypothetical protein
MDLTWQDCPNGWHAPFLPHGRGAYFDWPELTQIFPWQHTGSQYKRSWPISESEQVLERLRALASASLAKKTSLFKNSRDRKTSTRLQWNFGGLTGPLSELTDQMPIPQIRRYAFRALDRQYSFRDMRVGDYLKLALIGIESDNQIYLNTLMSCPLGDGPAVSASANVPDLHHFRGSFGGKDVFPLWRDSDARVANVTTGLLNLLEVKFVSAVGPEDLAAYVYAILSSANFSAAFGKNWKRPAQECPLRNRPTYFSRPFRKENGLYGSTPTPRGCAARKRRRGPARRSQMLTRGIGRALGISGGLRL